MTPLGHQILQQLQAVERGRQACAADAQLAARVHAVKHYQHQRLQHSYADLLADPRYAKAARFFLDDLYGPHDFTDRDAQFARVVPGLTRLFPADVVATVACLSELHALSEGFDIAMAQAAAVDGQMQPEAYRRAWLAVGRHDDRLRQVALMRQVGNALDRFTRNPLLRAALLAMRGPAHAIGLSALQGFLERGFDTFRALGGGKPFLDIVERRERALIERLFDTALPAATLHESGELP